MIALLGRAAELPGTGRWGEDGRDDPAQHLVDTHDGVDDLRSGCAAIIPEQGKSPLVELTRADLEIPWDNGVSFQDFGAVDDDLAVANANLFPGKADDAFDDPVAAIQGHNNVPALGKLSAVGASANQEQITRPECRAHAIPDDEDQAELSPQPSDEAQFYMRQTEPKPAVIPSRDANEMGIGRKVSVRLRCDVHERRDADSRCRGER